MYEQMSLFDQKPASQPLASRLRPETLDEYVGQEHLVGKGKILRTLIEHDQITSMIFWGPPGVGKTTLARIIAHATKADFVEFSAVSSGIKEVRDVMNKAEGNRLTGRRTLLFIDEIHRFNKAQQDAFLPYVEKGSITLIGATTENPSFEINAALLSRCRVFILKALTEDNITDLLARAMKSPKGYGGRDIRIQPDQLRAIAVFSNGDARTALNTLEMAVTNSTLASDGSITVTDEILSECMNRRSLLYDKKGDGHHDTIAALHKSMRNSDPDAAVYWMERMLESGEDPLYIARRVVRFASEDVGLADPRALQVAVSAFQACQFIGMPECNVCLGEAVVYCALAPKSNALEAGCDAAKADIRESPAEPVPLQIRNAPTSLMKEAGYGDGYIYAHDTALKIARMQCLPDSLKGRHYYEPGEQGHEKFLKQRLDGIRRFQAGETDNPWGDTNTDPWEEEKR